MSDWLDDLDDPDDESAETTAIDDLAPDAMSLDEAAESEFTWRILIWAEPGMGKTHFAYSMPEPVCYIDTEGKADAIAHKFDKRVWLWDPSSFDEAMAALDQALDTLAHVYDGGEGKKGTLVVDSMSVMWRFAQEKHVDKYYQGKSVDEVNLSTGFGSGQSDWQHIKRYHNQQFRKRMLDSPFHLCWTAMSEEDYSRKMEEDLDVTPSKPAGEKENDFKATDVIRIQELPDGTPAGFVEKAALTKHRYGGLRWPTFDKHQELIRDIEDAELAGVPAAEMNPAYDVTISEGHPKYEDND